MVKSILVPSATASSRLAAPASGGDSSTNSSSSKPSGDDSEAAASATKVSAKVRKCESVSDGADPNAPSIDFSSIFSELQKYKQENNDSLSIKVSHPAISRIIDSLSGSHEGVETLSKKRWKDQLAALKEFKENEGHSYVPSHHPTLGNWVRIQREQYKKFEQGISSSLTKKRYGELKAIGFSDGGNKVKSEERDEYDNNIPQNKKVKREATDIKGGNDVKPKIEQSHEMDSEGKVTRIKGKCDICEKSDGFWGHNMQQCKECGVLVHELCYGLVETDSKNLDFLCHACKAVGTEVEYNVPSKIGGCGKKMGKKRQHIRQEKRPTECILCTHDKGIHAMHPLLDTHGPEGRQLVIDRPCWDVNGRAKKEKKPAWVHTLCASVICSNPRTEGSVYGCDRHGNYYGAGGEEASSEEEEFLEEDGKISNEGEGEEKSADNSDEEESSKTEEESCSQEPISSFAIASGDKDYANNIRDHRTLKCFICGKKDKVWRFPVQCVAGDEKEHGRWKDRHRNGTDCFVAMHVGCARWGCVEPEGSHLETIDGKRCRLCFYTPGKDALDDGESSKDSYDVEKCQPVGHCYCKAHARDIVMNNPRKKRPAEVGGGSSEAVETKTEQSPRRRSSIEPDREARAQPRRKSQDSAKSSFKKSLNSIRPRAGKQRGAQKRKSGTVDSSDIFFGASKKVKVEFGEGNTAQYPSMGKSARSLESAQSIYATSVPASVASNSRVASHGFSRQSSGGRRPSPVPSRTVIGAASNIKEEEENGELNGSSKHVSSKRKAGIDPDLPDDGRFKRVKSGHIKWA